MLDGGLAFAVQGAEWNGTNAMTMDDSAMTCDPDAGQMDTQSVGVVLGTGAVASTGLSYTVNNVVPAQSFTLAVSSYLPDGGIADQLLASSGTLSFSTASLSNAVGDFSVILAYPDGGTTYPDGGDNLLTGHFDAPYCSQ